MKTKRLMALISAMLIVLAAQAQTRKFGIEASIGGGHIEQSGDDYDNLGISDLNDDQQEAYRLSVDYYLGNHFALTGGLFLERQGLMTDLDDGLGLLKHYQFGIQGGGKWYPLKPKYIVQPYIGANFYVNFINLSKHSGERRVTATSGYYGDGVMGYDLQSPLLSAGPKIGAEIRIFSSLSLCLSCDYRWSILGISAGESCYSNADARIGDKIFAIRNTAHRGGINIGLKLDLPLRHVDRSGSKLATLSGVLIGLFGGARM